MTGDSDHSMQDDTGFVRVERRPGPGGAWSEAFIAEDGTIVEIVEYDGEGRAGRADV